MNKKELAAHINAQTNAILYKAVAAIALGNANPQSLAAQALEDCAGEYRKTAASIGKTLDELMEILRQ